MADAQALRRRKIRARTTLIASVDYLSNTILLTLFYMLDRVPLSTLVTLALVSIGVNIVFLYLILSGRSETFEEPSMTSWQVATGCVVNLLALAIAPQIAYAVAINLFIPLAYGSLHFRQGGFIVAWILVTIAFGTIVHFQADAIHIMVTNAVDGYLFALVVSTALGRFLFINAEVSNIRQRLQDKIRALKKANGVLREVTEKDELTGFANRQAFHNILRENCNYLIDTPPFFIAILEVGETSISPDRAVHEKVIRAVSDILSCRLRRSDTIARYDDRQFSLLLTEPSEATAIKALTRALEEMNEINWEYYGLESSVPISVGLARWQRGDNPGDTLLKSEQALYRAQRNEQQKVVAHKEPSLTPSGRLRTALSPEPTSQ